MSSSYVRRYTNARLLYYTVQLSDGDDDDEIAYFTVR